MIWAQVLLERRHFFSWLNALKCFLFDSLSLSQICSLSHHPLLLSLSPDAHWSWQLPAAYWSSNPDTPSSLRPPPSSGPSCRLTADQLKTCCLSSHCRCHTEGDTTNGSHSHSVDVQQQTPVYIRSETGSIWGIDNLAVRCQASPSCCFSDLSSRV